MIRLKSKVSGPFEDMQRLSSRITEIGSQTDRLRSVVRFLQVFSRLEPIFDDLEEFPRAASYSYEIECILNEPEFQIVDDIKEEVEKFKDFNCKLRAQGLVWIHAGMTDKNQSILSKGIQVFSNLRDIPKTVSDILGEFQSTLEKESRSTFDMVALNQEMTESKKSNAQKANSSANLSQWASILWGRTEKLTDAIYEHACKVQTLETFLSRKKDNFTQITYLQNVVDYMKCSSIRSQFWIVLSQNLEKEIRLATKGSQFLLQVLQAGYPKLLRIFLDLFSKIALLRGSDEQRR